MAGKKTAVFGIFATVGQAERAVDALVVIVAVVVPLPVTDVGLNVEFAPVGKPLTVKVTFPPNPFTAEIGTVYVVEFPCTTVWLDGLAAIVKSATPPFDSSTMNVSMRVVHPKEVSGPSVASQ